MADYFKDQEKKSSGNSQDTDKNLQIVKDRAAASADQDAGVSFAGLNNGVISEPIANFTAASSERIIANGASIIRQGRDRPSSLTSGYGGQGATGASTIDIVAGVGPKDPEQFVDPNLVSDAARIYVSQLTDIDKNFDLVAGNVGADEGRSAIGMKADEVRMIGRNGIKIVTEGRGSVNSHGEEIKTTVGIDLIAGNDDEELQPIPRGNDLRDTLSDMMDLIDDLAAQLSMLENELITVNQSLASHTHNSMGPYPGTPTSPSFDLMASSIQSIGKLYAQGVMEMYLYRMNTQTFRANNLEAIGSKQFNSKYNNTN
jgi:hypothetical protein